MQLGDLARDLPVDIPTTAIEITGLTADSRAVKPGFLFAALRGSHVDGAAFAAAAASAGASAILADADAEIADAGAPVLRAKDPRRILALMAARFYPHQPEQLVAVTGTSGKTSVAVFARQIFEQAGKKAASIGTIGVVGPGGWEPGKLTTPDPVALHQTLDRLVVEDDVTHAAIEASSHGLDQRRLDGLRLTAAGFTNLGRDHMDYHADVADYLAAKLRLFRELLPPSATAVVNADSDVAVEVVAAVTAAGSPLMLVGRSGTDIRIVAVREEGLRQHLTLEVAGRSIEVTLPFAGSFQADNAVMAAGLAIAVGIEPQTAIEALAFLNGAPGRLEKVAETANGAPIFVDYAHKPEAIEAALKALRPLVSGRLIVVIGAGGDRDAGKRPLMGVAAAKHADIVIVTDDNPRSEDPAAIRAEVRAGAPEAIEIAGRGNAIAEAVAMLRSGDVLCVAGKGHETGQMIAGVNHPFSDHQAVAEAVAAQ
jgi:UDP-N-acetylmuramoyl-L-alanyl-D-glutamate--2,6-diaminopimelate ligase